VIDGKEEKSKKEISEQRRLYTAFALHQVGITHSEENTPRAYSAGLFFWLRVKFCNSL
jgi:hypothetical protein